MSGRVLSRRDILSPQIGEGLPGSGVLDANERGAQKGRRFYHEVHKALESVGALRVEVGRAYMWRMPGKLTKADLRTFTGRKAKKV